MLPKVKALNFATIVGCAAGQLADDSMLKELTDTVVHLETADSATMKQFFKWVSDTIEQGNKKCGNRGKYSASAATGRSAPGDLILYTTLF